MPRKSTGTARILQGNLALQDGHALDHAWNYFSLHAGQRISIFNCFLVVSGAIGAALAGSFQADRRLAGMGAWLGFLLVLVSFIFRKLDARTAFLIKRAEVAISEIESAFRRDSARIVTSEPAETKVARASRWGLAAAWTYGEAFRFLFAVMMLTGALGLVLSLARVARLVAW